MNEWALIADDAIGALLFTADLKETAHVLNIFSANNRLEKLGETKSFGRRLSLSFLILGSAESYILS
ncbi:MAG: hypothetical protein ABF868_10075 [Sporolactobacillus sp.]